MFLMLLITVLNSIYGLSFQTVSGEKIEMNTYAGKKILIVNVALGSPRTNQLQSLQRLQDRFADSLVVLAFPSNSFGRDAESSNDAYLQRATEWHLTFPIAIKAPVTGPVIQPLYQWLTTESMNGVNGNPVQGDFQKFLIDKQGALVGVFAGPLDPEDPILIDAITRNYQLSDF